MLIATTDCGENLAPQRRMEVSGFEYPIHMPFFGMAKRTQKFDVPLPLQGYRKPCSKITRLAGRLTVKYAPKIQDVKVKPVGEWLRKRIVATGIGNREVYLDELTDHSLKIRMKTDLQKQLKEVKFSTLATRSRVAAVTVDMADWSITHTSTAIPFPRKGR